MVGWEGLEFGNAAVGKYDVTLSGLENRQQERTVELVIIDDQDADRIQGLFDRSFLHRLPFRLNLVTKLQQASDDKLSRDIRRANPTLVYVVGSRGCGAHSRAAARGAPRRELGRV